MEQEKEGDDSVLNREVRLCGGCGITHTDEDSGKGPRFCRYHEVWACTECALKPRVWWCQPCRYKRSRSGWRHKYFINGGIGGLLKQEPLQCFLFGHGSKGCPLAMQTEAFGIFYVRCLSFLLSKQPSKAQSFQNTTGTQTVTSNMLKKKLSALEGKGVIIVRSLTVETIQSLNVSLLFRSMQVPDRRPGHPPDWQISSCGCCWPSNSRSHRRNYLCMDVGDFFSGFLWNR